MKLALVEGLKKSESDYKAALLKRIADASEKPQHWTAAAWLLERKYPEEYGRPETRGDKDEGDAVPRIALGVEVRVADGAGEASGNGFAGDDLDDGGAE